MVTTRRNTRAYQPVRDPRETLDQHPSHGPSNQLAPPQDAVKRIPRVERTHSDIRPPDASVLRTQPSTTGVSHGSQPRESAMGVNHGSQSWESAARVNHENGEGFVKKKNLKVKEVWTLPLGEQIIVPFDNFGTPSTNAGENESKTILDAFFLGKAIGEVLNWNWMIQKLKIPALLSQIHQTFEHGNLTGKWEQQSTGGQGAFVLLQNCRRISQLQGQSYIFHAYVLPQLQGRVSILLKRLPSVLLNRLLSHKMFHQARFQKTVGLLNKSSSPNDETQAPFYDEN
nr:uncharacterized protein LOC109147637 [Ipomoea batatas]